MRTIYIQTNVLPNNYGGRTKSIFQRANFLVEAGYQVEILFTSLQYDFPLQFAYLKQQNIIHQDVKLTAMIDDLRQDTELLTYQYKLEFNYDTPENTEYDFHAINNSLSEVRFKVPQSNKIILRDFIATDGTLYRRNYYKTLKKASNATLYNPNGSAFLELEYENINKVNTIVKLNYFNGKYPDFRADKYVELKTFWLTQYINQENSVLIIDARTEDTAVINAKLNLPQYFIFHSNHNTIKAKSIILHQNNIFKKTKTKTITEDVLKSNWLKVLKLPPQTNLNFICLTEQQKSDISKLPEYNGVNIEVIAHPITIQTTNEEYDRKRFVIVSRLVSNKNVLESIRAFHSFLKVHPDYHLDIYGSGSDQEKIINYISEHNLDNNIHFKGFTNQIQEVFSTALASLVTTKYEGFGLAIAESIACGCPIVAYPFKYGQKDLTINGQTGFISQERTIESLVEQMEKIISVKQNRKANAQTLTEYSRDNIIKKWENILI